VREGPASSRIIHDRLLAHTGDDGPRPLLPVTWEVHRPRRPGMRSRQRRRRLLKQDTINEGLWGTSADTMLKYCVFLFSKLTGGRPEGHTSSANPKEFDRYSAHAHEAHVPMSSEIAPASR